MSEWEKIANEFNAGEKPCALSGKCPKLVWGGINVIACKDACDCSIHDADNKDPRPIIRAWRILRQW